MDDFVDKELAVWWHSKSCIQWLNVQVETSDDWWSQHRISLYLNQYCALQINIQCW